VTRFLLVFLLLGSTACAHHPTPAAPVPVAFTPLPDGTAPRPFTPQQLHDALPEGTVTRYRISQAGGPTIEQRSTFTHPTDDGVTVLSQETQVDTGVTGAEESKDFRWTELVDHARFPADAVQLTDAAVDVPAGHFVARLYTVVEAGEGGAPPTTSRFYFDLKQPGPPVLYTVEAAGQEVFRMELLERSRAH
jgi:hypothetical protein